MAVSANICSTFNITITLTAGTLTGTFVAPRAFTIVGAIGYGSAAGDTVALTNAGLVVIAAQALAQCTTANLGTALGLTAANLAAGNMNVANGATVVLTTVGGNVSKVVLECIATAAQAITIT
jgi:hypothetical protein